MTDSAKRNLEASNLTTTQYLTFLLNEQEYGVELLRIQEIRGYTDITPLPNVPTFVKGMLNLRGTVLPVLDLRTRFGIPEVPYTKFTVIVVANVGARVVGLIVDAVSDVLAVTTDDIQPAPDFGAQAATNLVSGMIKNNEKLAVLLDLDRVLALDEITAEAVAAQPVN